MTVLTKFKLRVRNNAAIIINGRYINFTTDDQEGYYVEHSGSVNSVIDLTDTSIIGVKFILEGGFNLCVDKFYERDVTILLALPENLDIIKISGNGLKEVIEFPDYPNIRGVKFTNASRLTKVPKVLLPSIVDMSSMFYGCDSFKQDISDWSLDNISVVLGGPNLKPSE